MGTENFQNKKRLMLQLKCKKDDNCPICLDSVKNKSVYWTKCGHIFHKDCFLKHINGTHDSCYFCPMCRKCLLNDLKLVIHSVRCRCKKCIKEHVARREDITGYLSAHGQNAEIIYASRRELIERYNIQRNIDLYTGVHVIDVDSNVNEEQVYESVSEEDEYENQDEDMYVANDSEIIPNIDSINLNEEVEGNNVENNSSVVIPDFSVLDLNEPNEPDRPDEPDGPDGSNITSESHEF